MSDPEDPKEIRAHMERISKQISVEICEDLNEKAEAAKQAGESPGLWFLAAAQALIDVAAGEMARYFHAVGGRLDTEEKFAQTMVTAQRALLDALNALAAQELSRLGLTTFEGPDTRTGRA